MTLGIEEVVISCFEIERFWEDLSIPYMTSPREYIKRFFQ